MILAKMSVEKQILSFFLLVLFASSNAQACADGKVVVSGDQNYPPLTWTNNGDHLIGSSVALATKIFSELGIKVVPDEGGPWKRVLLRAKQGKVDLLLGVRKSAARLKYLDYIDPPITAAVQSVFVRDKKQFTFDSWDDLTGKTGNVTLGTSFGEEFDNFWLINLDIEYTETIEQGFKKLLLGRVDYVAGPKVTYMLYLIKERIKGGSKENAKQEIIVLDQPLVTLDEYFAFSKNSPCKQYIPAFQQRLERYHASRAIDQLLEEYFTVWFDSHGISEDESAVGE